MFFSDAKILINKNKKTNLKIQDISKIPADYWNLKKHFLLPIKEPFHLFKHLITADKKLCAYVFILSIITALTTSFLPFLSSLFVHSLGEVTSLSSLSSIFTSLPFFYLGFYLGVNLIFSISFQLYMKENLKLVQLWLTRLSGIILHQNRSFFSSTQSYGYSLSLDTDQASGLAQSIPELVRIFAQIIISSLLLLSFLGVAGLTTLFILIFASILSKKVFSTNHNFYDTVNTIRQSRSNLIESIVLNLLPIRIYRWQDLIFRKVKILRSKEEKSLYKISRHIIFAEIIGITSTLLTVFVAIIIYLYFHHTISSALVVLLILTCEVLKNSLLQLPQELNATSKGFSSLMRIKTLLTAAEKTKQEKKFPTLEGCNYEGKVIQVKQTGKNNDFIRDLSQGLSCQGENVALIQEFDAFIKASVYDNLTFNITCSIPLLYDYLLKFALVDKKQDCQAFLDQMMEEKGANFSGGEKQRLLLIRALISSPDYIILDEALNAVQPSLAQKIYQILPTLKAHKTTLLICSTKAPENIFDEVVIDHDLSVVSYKDLVPHVKLIDLTELDMLDTQQEPKRLYTQSQQIWQKDKENINLRAIRQIKQWLLAMYGQGTLHHIVTSLLFVFALLSILIPYGQTFLLIDYTQNDKDQHLIINLFIFTFISVIIVSIAQYYWNKLSFSAVTLTHNKATQGILSDQQDHSASYLKSIFSHDIKVLDTELCFTFQKLWFVSIEFLIIVIFITMALPVILPFFALVFLFYWRLQNSYRRPALFTKQTHAFARLSYFATIHQVAHCYTASYHLIHNQFLNSLLISHLKLLQSAFYWRILLNRWFSIRIFIYSNVLQTFTGIAALLFIYAGQLSVTMGVLAFTFMSNISRLLSEVVRHLSTFEAQAVSLDNLTCLTTTQIQSQLTLKPYQTRSIKNLIEANNISFSYDKTTHPLINNFSLHIDNQAKILFLGPSGVGKSTLLKLLLKELGPDAGAIYHRDAIKIAYVPQQGYLLPLSIYDNIDLSGEYSSKAIEHAAQMAGINLKDHNTDTESINSKALIQKILLARALLVKPDLLVLDEATSDIAPDEEERMLEDVMTLFPATAVIAISHNPSIAKYFTKTIVLGNN